MQNLQQPNPGPHLLVVSFDAFGANDIQNYLNQMPNLNSLVHRGTLVKKIYGIYPTLTYPTHTSIVTGCYPASHGIVNNTLLQPKLGNSPDWYWWAKNIKRTTLYQLAAAQDLISAAFLWPVTAGSKHIKYNIPEIFPNRFWQNQYSQSLKASSPLFALHMDRLFGHLRNGIKEPQLDDFVTAAATWTLEHKYPNLTLVHLVDLDSMRHRHGVNSPEAKAAILRLDNHLGHLLDTLERTGKLDQTHIAVLGDHYQIDVHSMIHLNSLLAQSGHLNLDTKTGLITNWKVLAKEADGACYIYFKDHNLVGEIKNLIENQAGDYIEKVLTRSDFVPMGADSKAGLMIEAKAGYYFNDEASSSQLAGANDNQLIEAVRDEDLDKPGRFQANHGFLPDRPNYQTTFVVAGPTITNGKIIDHSNLINEAPTLAQMLNLQFPEPIDGKVIDVFQQLT